MSDKISFAQAAAAAAYAANPCSYANHNSQRYAKKPYMGSHSLIVLPSSQKQRISPNSELIWPLTAIRFERLFLPTM
jgi:hypothetical protein